MYNLTKETLVPVKQIPDLPLFAGRDKRLHHTTIYNWINRGIRRVKLEAVKIGQELYTSHEALGRFIHALNCSAPPPQDMDGTAAPPPPASMLIPPPRWPLPEDNCTEPAKLLPKDAAEERVVLLPEEPEERVHIIPEEAEGERVQLMPEPSVQKPLVIEQAPDLHPPEPRQRVPQQPAPQAVEVWDDVPADWMPPKLKNPKRNTPLVIEVAADDEGPLPTRKASR
jgi:hypothetical protein